MAQTPVNLLANIWSQIKQQGSLDPEVEALYDLQSSARPRLEDVCKILMAEVNKHTKIFVIIDALDECEAVYRQRLLTELSAYQSKLKLMVTFRFRDADLGSDIDIEIFASDADIHKYVQERVQTAPRLRRWTASETSLLSTIVERVTEAARGM